KKLINLQIPGVKKDSLIASNQVSFYVQNPSRNVKVNYEKGKFIFHLDFHLPIFFTERMFSTNMNKNANKMEQKIATEMKKNIQQLVKKIQKQELDPFGLGTYARAYQYETWK